MPDFLSNLRISPLSCWLGFFAGILFLWLVRKLHPLIKSLQTGIEQKAESSQIEEQETIAQRFRQEVLYHAQGLHLAAPYFPLDEILIEPRLIYQPSPHQPDEEPPPRDIVDRTIPSLPDWPELASIYKARTISLSEALQGGAHLMLTAPPGCGKTVALAALASSLARNAPELKENRYCTPILLHAADLYLSPEKPISSLETLVKALSETITSLPITKVTNYLSEVLEDGQAILLLDGLDELPPTQMEGIVNWLESLLKSYPHIQIVVTAIPRYYGYLTKLGFIPIPLATWEARKRQEFLQKWTNQWNLITSTQREENQAIDPWLITYWLQTENLFQTPLELTLKAWASSAGDLVGASSGDTLEAYLRRVIPDPLMRSPLRRLALEMVCNQEPTPKRERVLSWLQHPKPGDSSSDDSRPEKPTEESTASPSSILDTLIKSGVVHRRTEARISWSHPAIFGYLAAQELAKTDSLNEKLFTAMPWAGAEQTLRYYSVEPTKKLILDWIADDHSPLANNILTVARWLQDVPKDSHWYAEVMSQLAALLQPHKTPPWMQARVISALLYTQDEGVKTLLRQLLNNTDPTARWLAALGLGVLKDNKAVPELINLLTSPHNEVQSAACLALVEIGTLSALEAVATALLHGDENLRQTAAEALANHQEEGHPTLKEGATLDDIQVRRASAYGLARIPQPWAKEVLNNMQLDDDEWVVRNTASRILEMDAWREGHTPQKPQSLTQIPWLITFAGERGMGVAPGKPALDMLLRMVKEGTPSQIVAALDRLTHIPSEAIISPLYHALSSTQGTVQEAVYNTLWHVSAAGINLPPMTKFGLG
ncbi:MAG: HEAT repeat domain-containing protein [Chloroflexota bacterium]